MEEIRNNPEQTKQDYLESVEYTKPINYLKEISGDNFKLELSNYFESFREQDSGESKWGRIVRFRRYKKGEK
jgi:hypothetical protein